MQRAGLDGGTGEVHPAEGDEQFGPDTGIGLGRPSASQGDRGGLGIPGVAERPGGEQPDVHVFMCQQRHQQRNLGGDGGPDGARLDLPFVIALGQPAQQAEDFGRPGPGSSGDPGEVRDGVHAGGIHRALVEDARVQLGDRLLGIRATLGEGAQQVGEVLGGAVGVRDGGPGVGVETGEDVSEIHGVIFAAGSDRTVRGLWPPAPARLIRPLRQRASPPAPHTGRGRCGLSAPSQTSRPGVPDAQPAPRRAPSGGSPGQGTSGMTSWSADVVFAPIQSRQPFEPISIGTAAISGFRHG